MQADLICVGNELLTGLIENSHAGYLSRNLWSLGITVRETCVVADREADIAGALERALANSDLVLITGGLGPTEDDLTRETVARYLGLPLVLNQDWLSRIEHFFARRGIVMPDNNRRQAYLIDGSTLLNNERGTAPGMLLNHQNRLIVLLPGPTHELTMIFENQVATVLKKLNPGETTLIRTLKCIGMGESSLEEKIKTLGSWDFAPLSFVARGYEVHLQIKAAGRPEEAHKKLAEEEALLRGLLGDYIYGRDDDTLAGRVAELFTVKKLKLAAAESCSGGLLSDQITNIPGSSQFFRGSLVTYSRGAKENVLGIDPLLLDREGIVSEATAKAMAAAAARILQADLGVGITGVAGPGSEPGDIPVGRVYIAVAAGGNCDCTELNLSGGRRMIKERTAQVALNILRKMLLDQ